MNSKELEWFKTPEAKQVIEQVFLDGIKVTEELRKEHWDDWKKIRDIRFNI